MKLLIHCVIAVALVAVSVCDTFATEKKVRFQTQGITCISMESEAGAIPRRLPGVISSEANMVDNTVTVVFDDEKISATAIREALTREGFPVKEEPKTLN
jgi:copper chaperone CopZ